MAGSTEIAVQVEATRVPSSTERGRQLAVWIQFPRRLILLLVAFGLAQLLIWGIGQLLLNFAGNLPRASTTPDWSISWAIAPRMPVAELLASRLPNTLLLLGAALVLACPMTAIGALLAVLVHRVEQRIGPLGSVLKAAGRLWAFAWAAIPVFVLGLLLIVIFAVRLRWLPGNGFVTPNATNDLVDRLRHLILPTLALAPLPATLTAQAVARALTLPHKQKGVRARLATLLKWPAVLLAQAGGLLSATLLVELVFAWPGVGRMAMQAIMQQDLPILVSILRIYTILILLGRLGAELFNWLERLIGGMQPLDWEAPVRWRKLARTAWVVVTLALLLVPLVLAVAGLVVGQEAAQQVDTAIRDAPPSPEHPWGTDALGRDVQARMLRGAFVTLGIAGAVTVLALLPAGLGGALTGWLASRRTWWSESLADLLLLGGDVLLFIPMVLGVAAVALLAPIGQLDIQASAALCIIAGATILILPRLTRFYQSLWLAAPPHRTWLVRLLAGPGALVLAALFAGFGLTTALDLVGLGLRPPLATLGGVLSEALMMSGGSIVWYASLPVWLCALSLYLSTDALVGFFSSKEALARLNE